MPMALQITYCLGTELVGFQTSIGNTSRITVDNQAGFLKQLALTGAKLSALGLDPIQH